MMLRPVSTGFGSDEQGNPEEPTAAQMANSHPLGKQTLDMKGTVWCNTITGLVNQKICILSLRMLSLFQYPNNRTILRQLDYNSDNV